jgi:hypothetical protein
VPYDARVSIPVDLAELAKHIESYGQVAFVVTAGEAGSPHVVSAAVVWDEGELRMGAGSRTGQNVALHGTVSLLWTGAPGADYCLIVDGDARLTDDGAQLAVRPTRAVLHRLAQADASLPSCVTVL